MKNQNKNKSKAGYCPSGSTLMELILVVVLFVVLVPTSLNIFLSARKIGGQSYVQSEAATSLGETSDILRFLRNQGFELLENGEFYLIRNPGSGSWLVKNDLPDLADGFERKITVSEALRHQANDNLYLPGDSGASYIDPNTKKIEIQVLWSPDYLPLDQISQTVYLTNWQSAIVYSST